MHQQNNTLPILNPLRSELNNAQENRDTTRSDSKESPVRVSIPSSDDNISDVEIQGASDEDLHSIS